MAIAAINRLGSGRNPIKHNELRFRELFKNKTPMVTNTAGVVFYPFSLFAGIFTDELYFIFITKITLPICSPSQATHPSPKGEEQRSFFYLIILYSYFTIALTAASPSTATTTIPAGAEIVASSEERTVLAIV